MTTTISGLKIPPVGEKNKLLKAELAFPSITALARDACTKQSSDLISPPFHRPLPYLGPKLYQHTDRNMRWEQRTRESRRNGEQGQKGEAGNEKREGKGVHNNGKRSNLQILSRPTFPVQNDVQPRLETAARWVCRWIPFNRCPFLGWSNTKFKINIWDHKLTSYIFISIHTSWTFPTFCRHYNRVLWVEPLCFYDASTLCSVILLRERKNDFISLPLHKYAQLYVGPSHKILKKKCIKFF